MRAAIQVMRVVLALAVGALLLASAWLAAEKSLWGQDPPGLLGYFAVTAGDGAMAPTFSPGDGVVLRAGAGSPGDAVAFRDQEGRLVLRRIVGTSGEAYITQGDGNPQPDSLLLDPAAVEGVCVACLPGMGPALEFFASPWGAALWGALWLLVVLLPLGLGRRPAGGRRFA